MLVKLRRGLRSSGQALMLPEWGASICVYVQSVARHRALFLAARVRCPSRQYRGFQGPLARLGNRLWHGPRASIGVDGFGVELVLRMIRRLPRHSPKTARSRSRRLRQPSYRRVLLAPLGREFHESFLGRGFGRCSIGRPRDHGTFRPCTARPHTGWSSGSDSVLDRGQLPPGVDGRGGPSSPSQAVLQTSSTPHC